MKIYVLYDEHTGHSSVFSTMERAERAMDMLGEYSSSIKEQVIDDPCWEKYPPGHSQWFVAINRDGQIPTNCSVCGYINPEDDDFYRGRCGIFGPRSCSSPQFMHCLVIATDKEHAVRVADEKRIQMIESGEWDRLLVLSDY